MAGVRLAAQCAPELEAFDYPGVRGSPYAMVMWDRDGAGPAQPILAMGGLMLNAGGVAVGNIVGYDLATGQFAPLGTGLDSRVRALAALPNGDLIAGGWFTTAGGVAANGIARWDGTAWSPLGAGLGAIGVQVNALAVLSNGDLVAGGNFLTVGGAPASGLARWDGTSWSALGGSVNGAVYSLTVLPNGDLIAAGTFTSVNGVNANNIARWNGTSWSPLGAGLTGQSVAWVYALAVLPGGDLVAGGVFSSAGGVTANSVARWNGTSWSAVGAGFSPAPGRVLSLCALPNGDVLAGGWFTPAGGGSLNGISRWDGTAWTTPGSGCDFEVLSMLVLPGGNVLVGGAFQSAGGVAGTIVRWDGTSWFPFGIGPRPGTSGTILAVAALANGDVVVGGNFTNAGGVITTGLARWDGASWSSPGSLSSHPSTMVHALLPLPGGGFVVGGQWISGVAGATGIVQWHGTSLSTFGAGTSAAVHALARLPNGDIVAAGTFGQMSGVPANRIARWNGTSWSALGSGLDGQVNALAVLPNGDLVAGGGFTTAGGVAANRVARWDGTSWSALGSGTDGNITALLVQSNGDLVVAGAFAVAGGVAANRVATWDGAVWSVIGAGLGTPAVGETVATLATLPNGDLVAGGRFSIGATEHRLARWDGASWSALDQPSPAGTTLFVRALARLPSGELMAGGAIGGPVAFGTLARITSTCAASVQSAGSGCGGDVLAASHPWTGSVWRADADGLPNAALVFAVSGAAPTTVPLSAVFTTAAPGCTLHVQPDVVDLLLANSGAATSQFTIPSSPSLAGIVFRHQMVSLALDPTLAVTATNALTLTVGSF